MSMIKTRVLVAVLAFSASGLVGLAISESYTDTAVIPVPGDRPTIGFGSTDGVKLGDKITPPAALARALQDVQKYEGAIKQCVKVPLYQHEYDAYTQLAYNIGERAFCESTLVRELNAGRYESACLHIRDFICGPATESTRAKPGAKCYYADRRLRIIPGLVARREREAQLCLKGPA